jgi:hypothetical protein
MTWMLSMNLKIVVGVFFFTAICDMFAARRNQIERSEVDHWQGTEPAKSFEAAVKISIL